MEPKGLEGLIDEGRDRPVDGAGVWAWIDDATIRISEPNCNRTSSSIERWNGWNGWNGTNGWDQQT